MATLIFNHFALMLAKSCKQMSVTSKPPNTPPTSLKRDVEAAGGKLRLDVELPDGSHFGFAL
ncbi:hypothetical protein [Erwinia sp. LJJL01]|uniref:hypothetical protein n=1 Tax=Erwinia sp. LJJL01 TaxID=3391839 RepID=UPI0039AF6F3B